MAGPHADLPPQAVMMQMIMGKCVSRCVSLVAELAIADRLKDGPKDIAALAGATGSNADALYRVLRLLSGFGIFVELANRQFQNSPLSEVLRSDSPGSVRHYARWYGTDLHWRVWSDLGYSVRTGRPAITKNEPDKSAIEVITKDPIAQEAFNDAMTGLTLVDGAAIVQAYDFSRFRRIVDVGSGHGTLAMMIAEAAREAAVVVFDLPPVIEETKRRLETSALAGRIEAVAGDFFDMIPGPSDLCVLKHIIHGFQNDMAQHLLRNCRGVLTEGGRVLVCEMLITPGPEGTPARIVDLEMLGASGGRERTEAEFSELFAASGLKLERVINTRTAIRILEASVNHTH